MRNCIKARSMRKGEELCHSAKPGQLPEREPDFSAQQQQQQVQPHLSVQGKCAKVQVPPVIRLAGSFLFDTPSLSLPAEAGVGSVPAAPEQALLFWPALVRLLQHSSWELQSGSDGDRSSLCHLWVPKSKSSLRKATSARRVNLSLLSQDSGYPEVYFP